MRMPFKTPLSSVTLIAALPICLASTTAKADITNQVIFSDTETSVGLALGAAYGVSVSDNGRYATGRFRNVAWTLYRAYLWDNGTVIDLGTLGGTNSRGIDISGDGAIVIGYSQTTGDSAWRAFRWTEATGMVDMGTLGGTDSYLHSMTSDGSVMAGYSQITGNAATHAFRWTEEAGMVSLGTLGGTDSYGFGVSDNGLVIVGNSQTTGNAATHVFR